MKRLSKLILITTIIFTTLVVPITTKAETIYYTDTLQTEQDLNVYAKAWLKDNYNMNLDIKIYFANCEVGLQGLFVHDSNNYIVISNEFLNPNDSIPITRIERVLRHELIHYALYEQNRGYWDGAEEFEREVQDKIAMSNNGDIPVMEYSNVKSIDYVLQQQED